MINVNLNVSKRARIIAAFPGMGKSYYTNNVTNPDFKVIDSDSSQFSWIVDSEGQRVRNPEFPANYIAHIKENLYLQDVIFVSTHKEVRDALIEEGLYFELCYPSLENKNLYIERYKERNSPQSFIDLIDNNWEKFISEILELKGLDDNCVLIEFEDDSYITDYMNDTVNLMGC